MQRYIAMRLFQMLISLLLLSTIIFGITRVTGDPASLLLPESGTEEDYRYIKARLGLDKPVYVQYAIFIGNALKGDLGTSFYSRRPVIVSIMEALPNTIKLAGGAFFIATVTGIFLGVLGAVKRGGPLDTLARIIAGLGQSVPTFWVGLVLIQIFVIELKILPSSGMGSWKHYLMPSFNLSLFMMAGLIRLLRSSMLEVLDSEFITLARIKGIPERVVIWKHALRNSLLAVLSFAGVYIALLVTHTVLIETVFTWPGFGRLAYRAIISRDFPLIQGVVMVAAVIVMGANLLTDILYAYIDPRIRYKA
ncbi:ABC transporter permease [Thermodesulfobacteriota bacterium]